MHTQIVFRAESVKLEQFAGKVLVGSGVTAVVLVQVIQHGRMLRHSFEHLPEVAEHVRAQDVAVVRDKQRHAVILPKVDIEVVMPKIRKHFGELFFAIHCAQDGCIREFVSRFAVPFPI